MRRLILRPLVLVLTFLLGLFVTMLLTFAVDGLSLLLDEPPDTIPAICSSRQDSAFILCSQLYTLEDEEAAVYSALIQPISVREQRSPFVIQDETLTGDQFIVDTDEDDRLDPVFEALKREFPQAEEATLDSFRANNQVSYSLAGHPFLSRSQSRLLRRQEMSNASHHGWWFSFHENYPGATGFFMVSKVGFNREMNQALVYRAYACADTCGYGSYVLLVKEGGVWKVRSQAGNWVS